MTENKKNFYITTPIYYANDRPHIGHAYTTLIGDVFARFYRKKNGENLVFFVTGLDEHGSKVAKSALASGFSPQEYVDRMAEIYQTTWKDLNISYDEFFRTTNPKHKQVVQEYLGNLFDKGYIYKAKYKGLYCVGCEKFLASEEIKSGLCIYHQTTPLTEQEEENYFLRLKDLSASISKALKEKKYVVLPAERLSEVWGRIEQGLNDVSISRTGVGWGIPVPWDINHTVYVWVDALLNYFSATRIYSDREKFWPPSLQLMAKDILWFHAIVWEGLLLARNLELPKVIYAHGFFTINGLKMSKSIGNIIDPQSLIKEYGCDGARYLIITAFTFGNDGDISASKFKEKYNADLANGIGNLVSRIARLCENIAIDPIIKTQNSNLEAEIESFMKSYRPDEALKSIWKEVMMLNRRIDEDCPWALSRDALKDHLGAYVQKILEIANNLEPFLPNTAMRIIEIFSNRNISKPPVLFARKK